MKFADTILEKLEPLFTTAEKTGAWFYSHYQGIWFAPDVLRAHHELGEYVWGPDNWILMVPSVEQKLEYFKNMINKSYDADHAKQYEQAFKELAITMEESGDTRYNIPKTTPKASEEQITDTINNTQIYKEAKDIIVNAQRKQVAYGIDKYPEPLNPNSWSTVETIDHIIDESIDKLHYLVMLRIKLLREIEGQIRENPDNKSILDKIDSLNKTLNPETK